MPAFALFVVSLGSGAEAAAGLVTWVWRGCAGGGAGVQQACGCCPLQFSLLPLTSAVAAVLRPKNEGLSRPEAAMLHHHVLQELELFLAQVRFFVLFPWLAFGLLG